MPEYAVKRTRSKRELKVESIKRSLHHQALRGVVEAWSYDPHGKPEWSVEVYGAPGLPLSLTTKEAEVLCIGLAAGARTRNR